MLPPMLLSQYGEFFIRTVQLLNHFCTFLIFPSRSNLLQVIRRDRFHERMEDTGSISVHLYEGSGMGTKVSFWNHTNRGMWYEGIVTPRTVRELHEQLPGIVISSEMSQRASEKSPNEKTWRMQSRLLLLSRWYILSSHIYSGVLDRDECGSEDHSDFSSGSVIGDISHFSLSVALHTYTRVHLLKRGW